MGKNLQILPPTTAETSDANAITADTAEEKNNMQRAGIIPKSLN